MCTKSASRLFSVVFLLRVLTKAHDVYLDEIRDRCLKSKTLQTCAKYKLFKYVDNYHWRDLNLTSDNSVKLVNCPEELPAEVTEQSRQTTEDSELTKMMKFFQRKTEQFLGQQGLSVDLPEKARILQDGQEIGVEEGRGKKKKQMIIPLIILFKLFKIKVLVSLALISIFVIKKTFFVAALILPSIVASIKNHCKAQQYHVVPYHVEDEHYHHEHHEHEPSGYGFSGYGTSSSGGDGHNSKLYHWDKNRKRYSHI